MDKTYSVATRELCISVYQLIGRTIRGYKIRNVKVLTWLQLGTITIVIVVVWAYNNVRPAIAHRAFRVVEGIIYNVDGPSALIGGQIVREGDTIYDARVIRIHRDKVEFEKDSKIWEQGVREQPNPAWEEPN